MVDINMFAARKVQVSGSSVYEPYDSMVASVTEQVLNFPQTMKSVMIANDGTGDILIGLQGKTVSPILHDDLNPAWAFTGTWFVSNNTSLYKYGTGVRNGNASGAKATYKPDVVSKNITIATIKGTSVGIATLELSKDNGVTWAAPSTFIGVTRSDGAVGASMDTIDLYSASVSKYEFSFNMPAYEKWAFRATISGTKNASSTDTTLWIDAALIGTRCIRIKAGETQTLPISTASVNYMCEMATQAFRVVGII